MNLRILNLCLIISFFPLIIEAKEIFFECPYDKNYLEDGWEDLTDEKTTDGRIYTHEYMIDLERGERTFTKNQMDDRNTGKNGKRRCSSNINKFNCR